jgi:hypothetical protein
MSRWRVAPGRFAASFRHIAVLHPIGLAATVSA